MMEAGIAWRGAAFMKRIFSAAILILVGVAAGSLFVGSWSLGQPGQPPPLPRDANYRDVVKRVLPAVVSIETGAPGW